MELNKAFKMPKPNEFIATNFDIKPKSQEVSIARLYIKNYWHFFVAIFTVTDGNKSFLGCYF